jgi:nucleotide-binding universal stress UspA family protein
MLMQESLVADQAGAADYLVRIAASDELAGIATTTEVLNGIPAQTILSVARAQQADIIIMCSHGYTGMAHWVMGSVAEKVARHAPVPVFVLREGGPLPARPHPDATHPLRALVALDGSARAQTALEPAACFIAALAAPGKGALHLAQVVKPATPGSGEKGIDEGVENESRLHHAQKYLSSLVGHFHEGLVAPAVADLKLLVTCGVAVDNDVASALIMQVFDVLKNHSHSNIVGN